MKRSFPILLVNFLLVFSSAAHARNHMLEHPNFARMAENLEKAYCEISNSVNYMYNYLDREDGGVFKYKAHLFSEKAKNAIIIAAEYPHYFTSEDGNMSDNIDLAKEKIIEAHNEIKDLVLYDPNRNRIRNNLVNPAKAAIRELNQEMDLELSLDACDTRYPMN